MTVVFEVPGRPVGKGRPRFARMGKYVRTYTPEETASYENLVKVMYKTQCPGAFLRGAIEAVIVAYFPIPKSTSKKKTAEMLEGKIEYTHKQDVDNIAKCILDSCNGIAYDDDAQISRLHVYKKYSHEPKALVRFTEIDEDYQSQKIGE